jgi:acetate kinase
LKVLVINSGSSSIKFNVFGLDGLKELASGVLERIGEGESRLNYRSLSMHPEEASYTGRVPDHTGGFSWIFSVISGSGVIRDEKELYGIGHRVVHGGERFKSPVLIDKDVIETIRTLIPLAPLHNPSNLLGIEAAMKTFGKVPQVSVFDTAFHRTMPPHAFHYALPHDLYTGHAVRRYGFHGTSHRYVARRAAGHLGKKPGEVNLVTLHLGNGASATAIRAGRSVDTSMGLTPLEGLMMGTRCGDLDPALPFYLKRECGMSWDEVESLLYHKSGLKGVSGTNDMRDIHRLMSEGHKPARLALEMYCYRVKKYIGAYLAVLGSIDAVVFTGGIGENSALVRKLSCEGLKNLGISIDAKKNESAGTEISEVHVDGAGIKILVVKTDEEAEIARQTVEIVKGRAD